MIWETLGIIVGLFGLIFYVLYMNRPNLIKKIEEKSFNIDFNVGEEVLISGILSNRDLFILHDSEPKNKSSSIFSYDQLLYLSGQEGKVIGRNKDFYIVKLNSPVHIFLDKEGESTIAVTNIQVATNSKGIFKIF